MTGTFTDIDGNYSLSVPSNGTLSVSMIGFTTQEITIGNQNVINVVLSDDTQLLNEAVFIGYGTQKKVNLTGASRFLCSGPESPPAYRSTENPGR